MLTAWSAGLGLPFIIAGLALGQVMAGMRKIRPLMPVIEVLGGTLVLGVGALIFLERFTIFNQYFTGSAAIVTDAEGSIDGLSVTGPLGFATAFAAGVLAFLSPCCLPLVPAYLAHLAGLSGEAGDYGNHRAITFRHSLAFVAGFSIVFVTLGASIGAVGFLVRDNLPTLEKIAGVLLIVLGLNMIGVIRVPLLYRTLQFDFPNDDGGEVEDEPRAATVL